MSIEKINASQPIIHNSPIAFKGGDEKTVAKQSSGNTKDIITALSVLAAVGAAGVAIFKHKSAKDAIKKAEDEAKKKIEEAEEKVKKAVEEAEKKIKEAEEKAKKVEEENKKTIDEAEEKAENGKEKTEQIINEAKEKKAIETIYEDMEYQGLSKPEQIYIELQANTKQAYGRNDERINELAQQLKEMNHGSTQLINENTPEITARIDVAAEKIERDYWQERVNKSIEKQNKIAELLDNKGWKPIEITSEEAELQVKYAGYLESSKSCAEKGDMEWAEKWKQSAEIARTKLKAMGKEPFNLESEEMQLQLAYVQNKRLIKKYRDWVEEQNQKIEIAYATLKEVLKV